MTPDNAPAKQQATQNTSPNGNGARRGEIDLDAILDQRAEATGEADTVTFRFAEKTWSCKHPLLADDEWREGLDDLDDNEDVARYYMGDEQYERFVEAGGRSGYFVLLLREIARTEADVTSGRPTRRSTSSVRHRRR